MAAPHLPDLERLAMLAVTLLATAALVAVAIGLALAADPALGPLVVLALAAPSLLACRRPARAA